MLLGYMLTMIELVIFTHILFILRQPAFFFPGIIVKFGQVAILISWSFNDVVLTLKLLQEPMMIFLRHIKTEFLEGDVLQEMEDLL